MYSTPLNTVDKFTAGAFQLAREANKREDEGPLKKTGKNGTELFYYVQTNKFRLFYVTWINFTLPPFNVKEGVLDLEFFLKYNRHYTTFILQYTT